MNMNFNLFISALLIIFAMPGMLLAQGSDSKPGLNTLSPNPNPVPRAYAPDFQCPESHPEYATLLNSLRELQSRLKSDLECKELSLDVDAFTDLIGERRQNFLDIITLNKDGVLSAEQAQEVQDYSNEVTKQAGNLINLLSNTDGWSWFSDKCALDKEERFAGIQRVTSAAYEASKLLSHVAGPYSVPISVAANIAMGVVTGLQTVIDSKELIDFKTFEKRAFFAESLCLFSSLENEVKKLNNAKSHLSSLIEVEKGALKAVERIKLLCPTCNDVFDFEFIRYDDEDLEREQLEEFRKVIEETNKSTLDGFKAGSKALEARENLAWVQREVAKYRSINDFPTSGIIPVELESISQIIQDFLINTASPIFLDWYMDESFYFLKDIRKQTRKTSSVLIDDLDETPLEIPFKAPKLTNQNELPIFYDGYILLYSYMKHATDRSVYSPLFYSDLVKTIKRWKKAELNLKIVTEYCDFFDKSTSYSKGIENVCDSKTRELYMSELSFHAFFLADIVDNSKELARRQAGPFDFSLDKYLVYFNNEIFDSFIDAEALVKSSKNGDSMNLITPVAKEKFIYSNWQTASKVLVNDLISSFEKTEPPTSGDDSPFEPF